MDFDTDFSSLDFIPPTWEKSRQHTRKMDPAHYNKIEHSCQTSDTDWKIKLACVCLSPKKNLHFETVNVTVWELTFLRGRVVYSPGTDECGSMVCRFGLFLPAHSFASVWQHSSNEFHTIKYSGQLLCWHYPRCRGTLHRENMRFCLFRCWQRRT